MQPTLRPGDRLLVDVRPFRGHPLQTGGIVVVIDPTDRARWLVKRVRAVGPGTWWVTPAGLLPAAPSRTGVAPVRPADAVETVTLESGALWVLGDAPELSRDSRRFGPIGAADVVGRVYRCYAPADRRRNF